MEEMRVPSQFKRTFGQGVRIDEAGRQGRRAGTVECAALCEGSEQLKVLTKR